MAAEANLFLEWWYGGTLPTNLKIIEEMSVWVPLPRIRG